MAERVNSTSQDTSAAEQAAEDLTVLFPDQTIQLLGEAISVTEYPFIKWLELKPICIEMNQQFADFISAERDVDVDEILECFENHFEVMQTLLCESIHKPVEFLKRLSDAEMQLLLLTWWGVNKHFLLKSAHRIVRKNKTQSDGQTSSSA